MYGCLTPYLGQSSQFFFILQKNYAIKFVLFFILCGYAKGVSVFLCFYTLLLLRWPDVVGRGLMVCIIFCQLLYPLLLFRIIFVPLPTPSWYVVYNKYLILMKKGFLFVAVMIFSALSSSLWAQNYDGYYFYGVDFSLCIVNGASESEDDFRSAYAGINELFYSEAKKYSLVGNTKLPVLDIITGFTNKRNEVVSGFIRMTTKVNHLSDDILAQHIKDIDVEKPEGLGLLIVAEALDKVGDRGYYAIVFFDNATREIKCIDRRSGRSGGFGLRNYWANTVHQILRLRFNCKL